MTLVGARWSSWASKQEKQENSLILAARGGLASGIETATIPWLGDCERWSGGLCRPNS